MPISDDDIQEVTLKCISAEKSVAPRDIAQALMPEEEGGRDWRSLLPRIKKIACDLANSGKAEVLRKGKPVSPEGLKGVYRIRAKIEDQVL